MGDQDPRGVARPPLARSPITPAPPVVELDGWEVSGRRSTAAVRITDRSPLSKVLVKAPASGAATQLLGAGHRQATQDPHGALVIGAAPGEWLLVGPIGEASAVAQRVHAAGADGLVTVLDVTHGQALIGVQGGAAAMLLARICAVDLDARVTPDHTAFRSSVAGVATTVVRWDRDGERGYLLVCERTSGQYLFDAVLAAGERLGADIDGLRDPQP